MKLVFHPLLVHFPIAFYFLELVLIALWIRQNDLAYRRFAVFTFGMGYGFMLAAMAAGVVDAGGFGQVRGAVRRHALAALLVFAVCTARALFYRTAAKEPEKHRFALLAGSLVGNAAVAYAGFLGGWLVYDE